MHPGLLFFKPSSFPFVIISIGIPYILLQELGSRDAGLSKYRREGASEHSGQIAIMNRKGR